MEKGESRQVGAGDAAHKKKKDTWKPVNCLNRIILGTRRWLTSLRFLAEGIDDFSQRSIYTTGTTLCQFCKAERLLPASPAVTQHFNALQRALQGCWSPKVDTRLYPVPRSCTQPLFFHLILILIVSGCIPTSINYVFSSTKIKFEQPLCQRGKINLFTKVAHLRGIRNEATFPHFCFVCLKETLWYTDLWEACILFHQIHLLL